MTVIALLTFVGCGGTRLSPAERGLSEAQLALLHDGLVDGGDARGGEFRNRDLTGLSLRNLDARGADFGAASLAGADFTDADLRGANFAGATLRGAIFDLADVRGADFSGADIRGADFSRCDRMGATFDAGVSIVGGYGYPRPGVPLDAETLSDGERAEVSCSLPITLPPSPNALYRETRIATCLDLGLEPRGVECLREGDCVCANLAGLDLSGRALEKVDFELADLQKTNFAGASLLGANLAGAVLQGTDFTGARLRAAVLTLDSCSLGDSNRDGHIERARWNGAECPDGSIAREGAGCLPCPESTAETEWVRSVANADLQSAPVSDAPSALAGRMHWVQLEPASRQIGHDWGLRPVREGCPLLEQAFAPNTPLLVAATETTQAQWSSVTGASPSLVADCPDCPVECVSAHEAMEFANRLSDASGLGRCYELTECEGEFSSPTPDPENVCGAPFHCTVRRAAECSGYRLPTDREWEWIYLESPPEAYREFPRLSRSATGVTCPENPARECGTLEVSAETDIVTGLATNVSEYVDGVASCGIRHYSGLTTVRGPGLWHSYFGSDQRLTRGTTTTGIRRPEIGFRLVRSVASLP